MALVFIEATSLPDPGSVRANPPLFSPVASLGSHLFFCSSVPYFWIAYDKIECVPIGPVIDIQPFDNSSKTIA